MQLSYNLKMSNLFKAKIKYLVQKQMQITSAKKLDIFLKIMNVKFKVTTSVAHGLQITTMRPEI